MASVPDSSALGRPHRSVPSLGNMSQVASGRLCHGLVAGLITVLCLLFVWYFVLPLLAGSRRAIVPQVLANLRRIDAAKEMWAADHAATNGAIVTERDLVDYLRPRPNSTALMRPVSSELYRLNALGVPPEAQLQEALGARFPKGPLFRFSRSAGYEVRLPNPQGGANGWQPFSSSANRALPAAAPRRSP